MTLTKWTFALALVGAVGGTSMTATATTAEARDFNSNRVCLGNVHSMAVAGGPFKPLFIKKIQARRKAIRKWRRKTADRFGFEYRKWRFAKARDVYFELRGRRVAAYIQGKPCTTNLALRSPDHDRLSSYGRRNIDYATPRRIRDHRIYN